MMKKRTVALLEVLIALTLIVLCAVPLMRQGVATHQAEMAQMERVEAGRIAAWSYAEIKEKFLNKEFRWAQIPILQGKSKTLSLSDAPLQLDPLPTRLVKREYTLRTLREKQEPDGRTYRLLAIQLAIGAHTFTYRLTVYNETSA